jgi:hypothetical protein
MFAKLARVQRDTSENSSTQSLSWIHPSQHSQSLPPGPSEDGIPQQAHTTSIGTMALRHDLLQFANHVLVSVAGHATRMDAYASDIVCHVGRHVACWNDVPKELPSLNGLDMTGVQANQCCFHAS